VCAHAVRHFNEPEISLLAQFQPDPPRPSLREREIVSTFLPGTYSLWPTNVGETSITISRGPFLGTLGLYGGNQSPKRSVATSIQCASHRSNALFCLYFVLSSKSRLAPTRALVVPRRRRTPASSSRPFPPSLGRPALFPRILVLAKCLKPNVCASRNASDRSPHGQNHSCRQFRP
jgi:hypothetical protein